jgi:N-methylhydantoinase A
MIAMPPAGTIAIDVGGTFTDIALADAATGATWVAKTPSTRRTCRRASSRPSARCSPTPEQTPPPPDFGRSMSSTRHGSRDILRVLHGTTTASNAILEGRTPPVALVTTAGFKYVLEIWRHDIQRHGNLYGWSTTCRAHTWTGHEIEVPGLGVPQTPRSRLGHPRLARRFQRGLRS